MTVVEQRTNAFAAFGELTRLGIVTDSGLRLPRDLRYEQWEAIGHALHAARDLIKWYVGDWLIFGESTYGDRATQAMDVLGWPYEMVRRAHQVAMAVPPPLRRTRELSWSHHREVAKLPHHRQRKVLEAAAERGLTVRETRELAGGGSGDRRPEPPGEFPMIDAEGVVVDVKAAARAVYHSSRMNGAGVYEVPVAPMRVLAEALGEPA